MAAFDDVLAKSAASVRMRSCTVLLDRDLADRHEKLDEQLTSLPSSGSLDNGGAEARSLADELAALEEQIDAVRVTFTFRSIGKRAWSNLLAKNPPTPKQRKDNSRLDHNPETFPIEAMAASCIEPEGASVEAFRKLEEQLTVTEFDGLLWSTCIDANVGVSDPKASVAAGMIRRMSERSASTPAAAESHDPGSLAES